MTALAPGPVHYPSSMPRLLVIDDDRSISSLLADGLTAEGFTVSLAASGEDGLLHLEQHGVDVVLLDVMLPGINGFEVLRRLRARSAVPVIMLTAKGEDIDRIVGLEIGADDYLPKPFNFRELLARLHAVLRRSAPSTTGSPKTPDLLRGGVSLSPGTRRVTSDGQPVDLNTSEFDLLQALLSSPGQPVSRETLCLAVFDREYNVFDRGIDNLVSGLRRKLGPTPDGFERIKTVRNAGYLFVDVA